jgi:methylenetetrahydrofolate dehydrogenase (NADP+)/methenyltetrahydrofolate cyclohydrolase
LARESRGRDASRDSRRFLESTMTAQLLDGNALAQKLRTGFRQKAEQLAAQGVRPGLAVIVVGDDAASQVYVRNKVNACAQAGFHSEKHAYAVDVVPQVVLDKIAELNADARIHGILVQLPLPGQFDAAEVLDAIAAAKDVDGFRAENIGALVLGQPCFIPCTPYGVMKFLADAGIALKGKEAVVVGRSNIVGKPMAMLLMHAGATVTVCHSQTRDLAAHCRRADILVAAIGKPKMITGDMLKPGAVVIDVGINRMPDGKLCGDVDFASASEVASFITPVPGGVGPMTITMLLANTLESAERAANA